MLYCQPVFRRGSGLGNRLFPWARCRIFSHANGIPMLSPRWFNPRVGPVLRGGINLFAYHRQILLLGLFKSHRHDVHGIKHLLIELIANRIQEPASFTAPFSVNQTGSSIIIFQGDRDHFRSLFGFEQFLHQELRSIARKKWTQLADRPPVVPIAVNVRCAKDFPEVKPEDLTSPTGPVRTPLDWFVRSLEIVRSCIGYPAHAFVVSDGTEEELRNLLSLENVSFVRPGCAISDLLLLARASVLIASGGSSFSAWASFLGGMPTITLPGQSLSWFGLQRTGGPYVGVFDPTQPSDEFIQQVKTLPVFRDRV